MSIRSMLLISTAVIGAMTAVPAAAQVSSASDPAINSHPDVSQASPVGQPSDTGNDVIVTAQKREQTLLQVPQSISVVTGRTLENEQASTFQDYLKLVPGLQLSQTQPGNGRLILRGINTGSVASTVAVYVDDTPFGSSSGLANAGVLAGDFDTFDLSRIEVLRGPQGTLYGANSLGGLLKFVTNAPDPTKVEARARGSVEATDGGQIGYAGNLMLNLPIAETLAIRATGFYRKYGGFIDSVGTPLTVATAAGPVVRASARQDDINDARSYGGRASLLFRPGDALSVRLSALLQNIATHGTDGVESDPFTLQPLYGGLTRAEFTPEFHNTAYRLYNGTADLNLGFATLTSVTSYATLDQNFRSDETTYLNSALGGALGTPDFGLPQQTTNRKFTQEVRLSSSKSTVFDWLLGGYYTHERGLIHQQYQAYNAGTLTQVAGLPLLADVSVPSTYSEYAGFANGTIYFGKLFDLTLGGRYSHNVQRSTQTNLGLLVGATTAVVFPETRSSDDVFTYSVAPKFNLNSHASIYGRVAKGYRPGGPNVLPAGASADTPRSYGPDTVTSYEGGFKGETADRAFSLDIAGFHIDWNAIQLLTIVNGFGLNANGGKAVSDGVEFTMGLRPTQGFNLSFNGAYTRARLTQDTGPLVGGFSGDRLPYVPKISVGVDGNYEWVLTGQTKAFVGASLRSLSKQNADFDAAFRATYGRQQQIPAYEVVDLRAGVDLGRFEVEAYAKNLTNSAGITSVLVNGNAPNGATLTSVIRPRTVGLAITAGF